jgi:hypothetical protein
MVEDLQNNPLKASHRTMQALADKQRSGQHGHSITGRSVSAIIIKAIKELALRKSPAAALKTGVPPVRCVWI